LATSIAQAFGQLGDGLRSESLARLLRMGELKSVYKGDPQQVALRELFRAYDNLVSNATRAQNRLKAIYRSRGIECSGRSLLRADQREFWLAQLPEQASRFRAQMLLLEIDNLQLLRKQAKAKLLEACRTHPASPRLMNLPGFGPVRVSALIAIVATPHRFRTKRQFWPYCGFSVVQHTSADYIESEGRIIKKQKKAATRGLNRNHHPQLKAIFKGAALTALRDETFRAYYDRLVAEGTKPELALISVARKLAGVALTIWQRNEEYDPNKVFAKA
jgi:transposase